MSPLNPEAPEFFPSQHNKLHQLSSPQHCYFILSSFPHPLYCPTATLPSLPFNHATVNHQPLTSQPEPTLLHKDSPDTHALVQHHTDEIVASSKASGSNGLVQKQVFNAFISCGTMESSRSDGFRFKAYARRRKLQEVPQEGKKNYHHLRNEHHFRVFPKKKRCGPLLPVRVDGDETTVMIRNIPSKYTRDMLVEFLEDHCMVVNLREKEAGKEKGDEQNSLAFDFVYLPIDFKSGLNKGYAFVNFTKPKAAWKFLLTASNMKWGLFQSHKIREVVAARLQGKEKLERHFETMNFPYECEDVLPVCFNPPRDGITKGKQRTMGKLNKHSQI
ncbi:hypothetical protein VNO77_36074 [Canavalia gladiata]|uniref:Mei2-like C-terminal RNA recognition motif domain-containing protein n=1 Tax=Canavalia gladiata TaxID=3824 RepID=A0AAN9PVH1_CANGL